MNITTLLAAACILLALAMGFLVLRKDRRSPAHLSFVVGVLLLTAEDLFNAISFKADSLAALGTWQHARLLVTSFLPGVWLFFSLTYGRGNYREFLARWKLTLITFMVALPALGMFGQLFSGAVTHNKSGHWMIALSVEGDALNLFFLIGIILVLMNLERTFRAAVGTMRWRIKFMILGLGVLFIVRVYTSAEGLLFHAVDLGQQVVDCGVLFVAFLLIFRSLLREGHFEIDVYPSHSVLQNSLTAILAGIYLIIIGLFAKIVTVIGGEQAFAIKAFLVLAALVALTILLLSDRVRLALSRFVSRHFQRPMFDYRTVWRKFTEATASCVSQAELCQAAVKSVTDIFQALSVTIWLVDDKKEQLLFAASTFLSEARAASLAPQKNDLVDVIARLQQHHEPVDIDATKEKWAEALCRCHPDEFRKGGNRVCVPMIVGNEFLGFMIIGDRVGGVPYSWQDFDLLKCISDQIAAGLLNTRLSQKLVQAKELEAFQTMSAFFVHDMKNTANTLNLMLQNLPMHFDNPEFRADALRGISKTVERVNLLISRLGSIRSELQIKPAEADLNAVIAKALEGWEEVAGIKLKKDFSPLPRFIFDADQMLKVAINLIFNARDAVGSDGLVHIATAQNNGWAVLSVSDNGCGMSQGFMNRQLFRAFQTTKKNGLGIGMFQSKMIVEAHQGRIEVESEPGKGTTFRVVLPLKK
ncbi:MAG TPA: XrtA/PEP-CTERM system histidine kinase PrsK [Candidatus Acidoferrales bacterium]|nr:XrtA/PEP-CTERM system histidine kinase PrsK [Candidatus Acidoferrales bacterium]